jgi:hypothetical protein
MTIAVDERMYAYMRRIFVHKGWQIATLTPSATLVQVNAGIFRVAVSCSYARVFQRDIDCMNGDWVRTASTPITPHINLYNNSSNNGLTRWSPRFIVCPAAVVRKPR